MSAGDPVACERFARGLAALLEAAGVPPCPRGIMAAAPGWRMRLDDWRLLVDAAAARPDAAAVLRISLLADLRPVVGDSGLVRALAEHVRARLAEAPLLVRGLAREALRFGRPASSLARLAGRILGFGGGSVDLKAPGRVSPWSSGVKALALEAGLGAVETVDARLAGLVAGRT